MMSSKFKIATFSIALAVGTMTFQGCDSLTNTQKGAGIGVAAGGVIGGIIGKKPESNSISDWGTRTWERAW